jgi:hypothetical protein
MIRRFLTASPSPISGDNAGNSRRQSAQKPAAEDPWHQTSALAYGIAGAAANEGRRDRARQQDRKNGVGHDGPGGDRYKEPVALAA